MDIKQKSSVAVEKKKPQAPKIRKQNGFFYYFAKITGAPMLLWIRHKVIYKGDKPKFKNAMLCANHKNFLDPIIIQCVYWYKDLAFLASTDVFDSRFKNAFFSRTNCIPVDKSNFSMDSFHAVCDVLSKGRAVIIFPEGGLNKSESDEFKAFKSGAVLMAHKTESPIIPIYIAPREKWYHRYVVVIGEAIYPREICGERPNMKKLNELSELIREKEEELMELYEEKTGKTLNK